MTKYFCDMCGEQMTTPFREEKFSRTCDGKPGALLIVTVRIVQGELCQKCVREVVSSGRIGHH